MDDESFELEEDQHSFWHSYADLFAAVVLLLVLVFVITFARNFLDSLELNRVRNKLKSLDEFKQSFTTFFEEFDDGEQEIEILDDGRVRFKENVLFGESHWWLEDEYYATVLRFRSRLHAFLESYDHNGSREPVREGASEEWSSRQCLRRPPCESRPDDEIQIIVGGHADTTRVYFSAASWAAIQQEQAQARQLGVSPRIKIRSNWDLSALRAATIVRALTNSGEFCFVEEFLGSPDTIIDPCRYDIRSVAHAEYQPLKKNPEGKSRNRRIEVEVRLNVESELARLGLLSGGDERQGASNQARE